MFQRPLWWLTGTIWLVACSGGTEPGIRPCTGGTPVNLAVNQYVSLDAGVDSGCVEFPATSSIVEYLVVPQLATGTPGQMTSVVLGGDTIRPPVPAPPVALTGAGGSAEQFHAFLRIGDERRSWGFAPEPRSPVIAPSPAVITSGPPALNSLRTFMVCGKLDCSRFDKVGARVRALKAKVAIYVDTLAPAGGLDSTAIDSIAKVFDQRLYAVDTAAFGRESDIDTNTVVLVLMTNVVNKLVTASECDKSGFVAGFFFGADLDPAFRNDSRSNKGEVFYSVVADPQGTLSCSHTVAEIQAFLPVTFVHEFQHMISFNQHFLVRGNLPEDLWLNEGLSHYAEENGGRTFLPDTATFCRYAFGDLYNASQYFTAPQNYVLVDSAGIGGLANRGAYWLFVRYLVDQIGPTLGSKDSVTRRLDRTSLIGPANVSNAAGGTAFPTILTQWALANYVSDLPGFTAPPELQYTTWKFRTDYQTMRTACVTTQLPSQFPLAPAVVDASTAQVSGMLHAGSASYYRMQHAAGASKFTLLFSNSAGGALRTTLAPRLNVIRLQ